MYNEFSLWSSLVGIAPHKLWLVTGYTYGSALSTITGYHGTGRVGGRGTEYFDERVCLPVSVREHISGTT